MRTLGRGIVTVQTCINTARALRDFGDGFVAVLLPVYLIALGLSTFQVGVVATVALFGSATVTLAMGNIAVRIPRRTLLMTSAALMITTGVAFIIVGQLQLLLVVAFIGTINPTAGNVSIFVPLEHAVLSDAAADENRTRAFGQYTFYGALASSAGALASGLPDLLAHHGFTHLAMFRAMFGLYAVLGLAILLLYSRLSVDADRCVDHPHAALGPSRMNVYKLAALFSIDAFAGGFAVQSLLALWLFAKFGLSLQAAGTFFFVSGLLAAASLPIAAWLSRHIGLVNTMVFTHIPSSVFLILAAVVPSQTLALALLLARAALSQMDVPARSSYVMAIVSSLERPAAASVTAVPRSLASALSPALAGALMSAGLASWPLILCGVLKIGYDFALLFTFRNVRPPEEEKPPRAGI